MTKTLSPAAEMPPGTVNIKSEPRESNPGEDQPIAETLTLLSDPFLDADHLMLEGIDTSAKPLFTVSEMAMFFFARSSHWVRWLETCNYVISKPGEKKRTCPIHPGQHTPKMAEAHRHTWRLALDGELLTPLRTDSNARKYDLALVEKIAHALASSGTIQGDQLRRALTMIRIQAEMHGYIASPEDQYDFAVPGPPDDEPDDDE